MDQDEVEEGMKSLLQDSDASDHSEASVEASSRKTSKSRLRAPLAICHQCGKNYYSLEGYKKHLNKHAFKELLDNAPTKEEIVAACCELSMEVLNEMSATSTSRGKGPDVLVIVNTLTEQSDSAVKFFESVGVSLSKCFPGFYLISSDDFHEHFMKNYINLISVPGRESLINILNEGVPGRKEVIDSFYVKYMRLISVKVEAYLLKTIREFGSASYYEGRKDPRVSRDRIENEEFKQSVHYIGGATVKSVLSKALKAKKTIQWGNIARAINEKMLVGELVAAPPEKVTAWTQSRDRKGLKFIGEKAWLFFVALTDILKYVEDTTGSVPHDVVETKVAEKESVQLLWSDMFGASLAPEESKVLLSEIVKSFTNTWGHGVVLRMKNASGIGEGEAVTFRAKLAH